MKRCRTCVIPDTRPDTYFDETGQCSACKAYLNRPLMDWDQRMGDLVQLLSRSKNGSGYDCIVPSSGGKDSTYQVIQLLELGAKPLVVTASTCHLTPIGRANIDNLARYATTIEFTPNREVRRKLNRLGLEMVGDISWPEHASIFSAPFRAAVAFGIPLIFYGECPQNQYGGPPGSEEQRMMTRRWVSEFGGFLGLRPSDFIGQEGITEHHMRDYMLPDQESIDRVGVEAHFLGQYIPWDSERNAIVAIEHGFTAKLPTRANLWEAENLDNAQTGIHDHLCYRKYGFGRLAAQASVDVRRGKMTRDTAMALVRTRDGEFPYTYAGVGIDEVMSHINMDLDDLLIALDRFTNWELFDRHRSPRESPLLKEFV